MVTNALSLALHLHTLHYPLFGADEGGLAQGRTETISLSREREGEIEMWRAKKTSELGNGQFVCEAEVMLNGRSFTCETVSYLHSFLGAGVKGVCAKGVYRPASINIE